MKRAILLIFSFCLIGLGVASISQPAYAVDVTGNPGSPCNNADATSQPAICGDTHPTGNPLFGKDGIITVLINILSIIIGVAAVVVILVAGLRFALSGGDSNAVASARSAIIYAVVGLVVAASAQAIIAFVLNKL